MANTVYITAGLPIRKDNESAPTGNKVYMTAGLPPEPAPPPTIVKRYFKLGPKVVTGLVVV